MRIYKLLKILLIIIATPIVLVFITFFVPLKFCLKSIPQNSDEDFYIVQYSNSKLKDVVVGDKNGLYDKNDKQERFIHIKGNEPMGILSGKLSVDLYMQGDATYFIVYGIAQIDESWDKKYYGDTSGAILYTINCTHWDILGKIKTTNSFRKIFSRNYLTIWDYKWFDILRDHLFGYLDGTTGF